MTTVEIDPKNPGKVGQGQHQVEWHDPCAGAPNGISCPVTPDNGFATATMEIVNAPGFFFNENDIEPICNNLFSQDPDDCIDWLDPLTTPGGSVRVHVDSQGQVIGNNHETLFNIDGPDVSNFATALINMQAVQISQSITTQTSSSERIYAENPFLPYVLSFLVIIGILAAGYKLKSTFNKEQEAQAIQPKSLPQLRVGVNQNAIINRLNEARRLGKPIEYEKPVPNPHPDLDNTDMPLPPKRIEKIKRDL